MFIQRSMFLYFFIFIILIVIFAFSSAKKSKDAWLNNLSEQERKLYKLEMAVSSNESELNSSLAPQYYEQRQRYCNTFKMKKEYRYCMQRTQPWWAEKYKEEGIRKVLPQE